MIQYTPHSPTYQFNWLIKREPVFRLLDDVHWANNFFETGEIKLSCFNLFRKYPDEMQGDKNEGEAMIGGYDSENKKSNYIQYDSGHNAFIMSTTKQLTDDVINDFNAKCAIQIDNPSLFAFEISKKLPFVNAGLEGSCDYADSRVKHLDEKFPEFYSMEFSNNPRSHEILGQITMGMELFLKLEKYKHQQEYRFIWFANEQINDSVIIKCPEAINFCKKIIL